MLVTIVGQGYVGQAIGKAARNVGYRVVGIENDQKKIEELREIGYSVTSEFNSISQSSIVIIAVPTPLDENFEPDLTFIKSACASIKQFIRPGTLVINESTSFPGTVRNLILPILGENLLYASAPERVDPANSLWRMENTPRVVGGLSVEAGDLAVEFYKKITKEVIRVSTPEIAESSKLLENTFRQVNIAMINEFSQIMNALGIPALETIKAASSKPFGFMPFFPSVGVGGHCIPVDPIYLSYAARGVGLGTQFIDLANKINRQRPKDVARQIFAEFELKSKSIQVVGISYKTNTPDMRESPVPIFINELRELGAKVIWHDPLVRSFAEETSESLQKVDLGIICNPHNIINFDFWKIHQVKVLDLSTSSNTGFEKYF